MATSRTEVNRRNAKRSTGPRSVQGKARAAQNARRHGLAGENPLAGSSREVEDLARALAGNDLNPERLANARTVAEMEVMLGHICKARVDLINRQLKRHINSVERLSECDTTAGAQSEGMRYADDVGETEAVVRVLPELLRFERYEARARTRRNRALLFLCR